LNRTRGVNEMITQQVRVMLFISNCYVCQNGNNVSTFFKMKPPTLEWYLSPLQG